MKAQLFAVLSAALLTQSVFAVSLIDVDNGTAAGTKSYTGLKVAAEGDRVKYHLTMYHGQLIVPGDAKAAEEVTAANVLNVVSSFQVAGLDMEVVNFLGISGKQMADAFNESLAANQAGNPPAIGNDAALLAAIKGFGDKVKATGSAKSGTHLQILWEQTETGDVVSFSNEKVKISQTGPKGFARAVLAFWFGYPSDSGMTAFKAQLVEGLKGNL